MAVMTVMVDVPQAAYSYCDQDVLRRQLSAFARFLVASPTLCNKDTTPEDVHIFDGLHSNWGGDEDVVKLASSLRSSRSASRTVGVW